MHFTFHLIAALLFLFLGTCTLTNAASSANYYFKHFSTAGNISPFYNNDNSWGVNAPSGNGFVAMVTGEDWGTYSPVHVLPKKIKDVSRAHSTWFSQDASPEPGSGYNACYDIFIDPAPAPTDRNSLNEVMIWLSHASPNGPTSNHYGADGKPDPWETNVNIAGRAWDIYLYQWPTGGYTVSYVDRADSGWWAGSLSPFFDHGISNGWYSADQYLNSVMAGWEFENGNYSVSSFGAIGF